MLTIIPMESASFIEEREIIDLGMTRMRGLHNAENVMAAVAACHSIGVPFTDAAEALLGFTPPQHRCEWICSIEGVEYLNDSKATNLHALDSALRSQTKPVVLIAGGKEKGLVYEELLERLEQKVQVSIVYGEIAGKLCELFSSVIPTHRVETLDEAVPLAHSLAKAGELVLLSPGTSSFDQFVGYEARGDHFRALVEALKESEKNPK